MTNSSLRPTLPAVDQARTGGKGRRLAVEFQHHLAERFLEMIGRAIDPQHAVDQDADPVGHAFDVAEDVRTEQDRAAAALDDLDQRFEEIAAHDGVEPERRIVEDQQLRIGGHGQGQGDLRPLAVREPADFRRGAKARSGRESAPGAARSSADRTPG